MKCQKPMKNVPAYARKLILGQNQTVTHQKHENSSISHLLCMAFCKLTKVKQLHIYIPVVF